MARAKRMTRAEHKVLRDAAFEIYKRLLADPENRKPDQNYRELALESFRQAHAELKAKAAAGTNNGAPGEVAGPVASEEKSPALNVA